MLSEFQKFVKDYKKKIASKLKELAAAASDKSQGIQMGSTVIKVLPSHKSKGRKTNSRDGINKAVTEKWGVVTAVQGDEITVVYTDKALKINEGVIEKRDDLVSVEPCACGRVFDPEEQAVLEVLLLIAPAQLCNRSTSFALFRCETLTCSFLILTSNASVNAFSRWSNLSCHDQPKFGHYSNGSNLEPDCHAL